eukprot:m.127286 g.127286  ORF g.127286 m.127286 type:complete len:497 (-) comp29262_c0_seq4:49-1539(-)
MATRASMSRMLEFVLQRFVVLAVVIGIGVEGLVDASVGGVASCKSNVDCNSAGECEAGACVCSPPFTGVVCEQIMLYSFTSTEGGFMMSEGNSTWGGSVVEADDGSYHMYAALMSNNKSLSAWLTNSVVAHAVSSVGPQGPYTFSDVALPARGGDYWDGVTCHNPDAKRTPDGQYVIYYMGSKLTAGDVRYNQRIGVAYSRSPYGPWTRSDKPIIVPGAKGKWDDGFTTNPAPYIFPNGSVLIIYKAKSLASESNNTGVHATNTMKEGVAWADSWNGSYTKLTPNTPLNLSGDCEDATIYRAHTSEGPVFRMLTHCGCSAQYLWSLDGIAWQRTTQEVPWCRNIPYVDGTTNSLTARQRPKWLVNSKGVVTHVFTAVNRPRGNDRTWTMAAAVTANCTASSMVCGASSNTTARGCCGKDVCMSPPDCGGPPPPSPPVYVCTPPPPLPPPHCKPLGGTCTTMADCCPDVVCHFTYCDATTHKCSKYPPPPTPSPSPR